MQSTAGTASGSEVFNLPKTFSNRRTVYLGDVPPRNVNLNALFTLHTNLVRTSQETHYISATATIRLMLFRETVAVYFENHTEHINTLCGGN
jgi:hypothetical protein